MAKIKRTPRQPLVSTNTNPRGLAAGFIATHPSPYCFQLPGARCPPTYLTQDQRGELSRSGISAAAASKASKPADDSGDGNNDNDDKEVQSIDKKSNDGGDDEQEVKEGGMSAAAKAALSLWCHLLELTKLNLNLLCQLKVAPKISAYAHVHGPHNY
jgi:hypothetical protein